MLPVRSPTTAKSMGLGARLPQAPLQAADETVPVEPWSIPRTGANPNGTGLSALTRMVLHWSPSAVTQGIAQILALHRSPGYAAAVYGAGPGMHVLGMWSGLTW